MDILVALIAEIFTHLFGNQANKVGLDREEPKFINVLFFIPPIAFIAAKLINQENCFPEYTLG